ncbi:MAG: UxaA family hydrolase [Haloarculaceae archaeon]
MKGRTVDDVALVLADDDTVATAVADIEAGRRLETGDSPVVVAEEIPFGHKLALRDHAVGDPVRKYGEVIGEATDPIERGEWVHTHNADSRRAQGDVETAGGRS